MELSRVHHGYGRGHSRQTGAAEPTGLTAQGLGSPFVAGDERPWAHRIWLVVITVIVIVTLPVLALMRVRGR